MGIEQQLQQKGLGPPADTNPTALVRRLMDSKRPSEVVPFPRMDDDGRPIAEVRIMVLSQSEIDSVCANAEAHTQRVFAERKVEVKEARAEAWSEIYNNAKCIEVLWEACREKDDITQRAFTTPSSLRHYVTVDEAAALFQSYTQVQYRFGPLWRLLTDDEIDQWIAKLTEGFAAFPLSSLGAGELAQLTVSLAYQLSNLRTDIGSVGSPVSTPEEGYSETPE